MVSETYDHSYTGWTSIERATLRSDNTVYAQLTLDVGPEAVADMARKLGVRSPLDVKAPSCRDRARRDGRVAARHGLAYATLAAGGIRSEPMAIRKVVRPSGDTEAGWGKPSASVISDGVAYAVTRIGRERRLRHGNGADYGHPAAGKTGTTEEHSDAWFCGYTPRLGTTVWVGYPRGKIPMESVHGISVAGGTFPAQIWRLFMSSDRRHRAALVPRAGRLARVGEFERGQRTARSATATTTMTTRRRRRRGRRRPRTKPGPSDTAPPASKDGEAKPAGAAAQHSPPTPPPPTVPPE